MTQDASNYRRYIEVARVYLKQGQEDEGARILGSIIEPMLAGREENDLLELVNELLARNPEHVPGLRLLVRIHWWQRDMEKLRGVLERLAEAAEAAGLAEDERYALTQLVRLVPEEEHHLERLSMLGGGLEESAEATNLVEDSGFALVPSFESFNLGETEVTPAGQPDSEALDFEWNSVADDPSHEVVSFADLNEPETSVERGSVDSSSELTSVESRAVGIEPVASIEQRTSERFDDQEDFKAASVQAMMRQELESVDFYITQGYYDIAFDTLELLERQFGPHPEVDSRRKRLESANQGPQVHSLETVSEPAVSDSVNLPENGSVTEVAFGDIEIEQSATASIAAPTFGSGIDSGLAEVFEEFRMEAEGEFATSNEDFETHYNLATAYKEMDLLDEAIREFQVAAGLTTSADGTTRYFHCCNMLGHCFVQKGMPQAAVIWFKKGLTAPGRNAEESKALQYELGSAYEQMDDFTNAAAAFTEVYGADVDYRDIADRLARLQTRVRSQKKEREADGKS
jgi:tetratricopeptide (TPR) repeat protein